MNYSSREAGIPILTEIISASSAATPAPGIPAEADDADHRVHTRGEAVPDSGLDWDTDKLHTLTNSVRESVLRQLQEQLNDGFNERIRVRVALALQAAVNGIVVEIKNDLLRELADLAAVAARDSVS